MSGPVIAIEAEVEDPRWTDALGDPKALAREAAALALGVAGLGAEAFGPEGTAVTFLFADDAALADLNGRFRGRPAPTNVLSWPAHELRAEARGAPDGARPAPPPAAAFPDGEPDSLGDVAMSLDTAAREAAEAGRPLRVHALHLAVHGVLHLLGYDHEREADAELMEGLERRAMLAAGAPDPYLPASGDGATAPAAPILERSDGA